MDPGNWLGEQTFDVDGAKLRLTFAMVNGRPEVVGFELWTADPRSQPARTYNPAQMRARDNNFNVKLDRPISSNDLRAPLQKLTDRWLVKQRATMDLILDDTVGTPASPEWKRKVRKAQKQIESATAPRPGRKPIYGRDHFEKVAAVYRQALMDRKPPTKAVAKHWKVNVSTAAKWVSRCRSDFTPPLLPSTTQGKPASVEAPRKKRKMRED